MTKHELIDQVCKKAGGELTKRAAAELVDCVFETVAGAVKKNKRFSYPGFGTWVIRTRKARTGRNPRTGEVLKIKASKTIGFKPARVLKETL
jgi:DNA-binding protein HU-beta